MSEVRLIDADELLTHLNACLTNGRPLSNLYDLSEIVSYVESMPTVDAVQVVRCGDCRYIRPTGINGLYECVRMQLATKKDEFCSRGDRKEKDDEID